VKIGIVGAGGFGRELYWSLSSDERKDAIFFVDDLYFNNDNPLILPLSKFEVDKYKVIVAVANPKDRFDIVNRLPKETKYFTHIHSSVVILGDDFEIGEGSVICAGSIITTNVKIGKHSHLNLQTTIGHDCKIGDYFTTAPGAKISGNCNIDKLVYVGTNASIREKINICNNVTLGLNCGVIKNISESGIYIGTPSKKIN
jgi:sugar O-acyltransferase (sialic acid O-acetyltransferase NeuD family)